MGPFSHLQPVHGPVTLHIKLTHGEGSTVGFEMGPWVSWKDRLEERGRTSSSRPPPMLPHLSLGFLPPHPDSACPACEQRPGEGHPEARQDYDHRTTPHLAHSDWRGVDQGGGAAQGPYLGWLWQEKQVSSGGDTDERSKKGKMGGSVYAFLVFCNILSSEVSQEIVLEMPIEER